jgi:hypothetical protein
MVHKNRKKSRIFMFLSTGCSLLRSEVVMSTIPKRKYKRSDIEANYWNETKTF